MLKKIGLSAIVLLAAYFLYACGDVENSVNGKTVASVSLSPASFAGKVGSQEAFYCVATFTDGTNGQLIPSWEVTGGIGTVLKVGYAGIFTASKAGTGEVRAVYAAYTASATLAVSAAPTPEPNGLASLEVSPSYIDLPVNGSQVFAVLGFNASGESVDFTPAWSLTGLVGTFTSSGKIATLEATTAGTAVITCSSGEIVTTVPVTVEGAEVIITAEADTYVDESSPTTTEEGQTFIKAGYNSATGKYFEAYLRFSLASLPAGIVSIESVTLKLYPSSADSPNFQFYNLNSPLTAESVTWNTKPADGSLILSGNFSAGGYNNISDPVLLTTIRGWYATPATNFGLALRQDSVTNGLVTILSKENGANPPVLQIIYK
ncbi:MAG: DNRLRE domain-containing protein [Candidatus Saganbacteria bacterium]|nr:DNRLRE domain-containing protein [Candidatus Saganbacteria bacterium]